MGAIWQKMKADILSRPLISALTVVTIVTSSALLTLAAATLMNINAPYDKTFEELDAAHLWLYFDHARTRSQDIKRIEALPGVMESTGVRYSVTRRVRIGDERVWVSLRAIPLEPPSVNRLLVQEGHYLTPNQSEVLASRDLDYLHELPVGSEISITREDDKEISLPVIGLAYNPMWDIYRNTQPPYVYVSQETLRDLFPDESTWDWSIGLRLTDPSAVNEMLARIEEVLRPNAIASHANWQEVRESAMFEVQLNFILLSVFGLFAILAAVLVVASSIGTLVLAQFRQIGILKAIGFTRGQVLSLYLGQYLVLSLIGAPLGLLLGIALAPLSLQSAAVSLSTTFRPPVEPSLIALILGIVSVIVVLATLGPALRGAQTNTIKAITTGVEPPRKRLSWIVRLATSVRLPITLILGLNDVFAKPLRSTLTGLNLTLGVMGIVCGLTLNETLNNYMRNPRLLGIVYDAVVTREETSDSQTQRLLRQAPGVEAYYGEYLVEVETLQGQTFQMRAVEGDLDSFPLQISKGRFFQPYSYETIAGQGLLDWLDLSIGDELTLIVDDRDDKPTTWRIVGQYAERSDAGQMLMVNFATVKRLLRHAEPSTYYLKLSPNADVERLRQHLAPKPDADLAVSFVGLDVPDTIVYLQIAIFALACILISIALINMFNTSLLAVREKLKTIGILKTVGMTPYQVVTMTNATAGFLGFLAAGVGFPSGLVLTRGMLAVLSRAYGFGGVSASLSILYLLLLTPLIVMISIAGSFIPGWWATRQSIVQAIRSE